jgi:predicted nucleic acid-binding protein
MDLICLDTNILIDHRRAKDKTLTRLFQFSQTYSFAITTITVYELFRGDDSNEDQFWSQFFNRVAILDFTQGAAQQAGIIYRKLKSTGSMIGVEDILIASIAITNHLPLASDNVRHFNRIEDLVLV